MSLPAYLTAGTTHCLGRPKLAYPTWWQARLRTLWARDEKGIYLDEYQCPVCEGWHVYNLAKEIAHQVTHGVSSFNGPVYIVELLRRGKHLKVTRDRSHLPADQATIHSSERARPTTQSQDQAQVSHLAARQAQRELNRKLAVALRRLSAKEKRRLYGPERRLRAPGRFWVFVYHHRGKCPTPRVDSPRSEALMAKGKMLGYWNGFVHKHRQGHCSRCSSGKPAAKMRRRNRMRWKNITRQEVNQELAVPHHEMWGDRWRDSRPFDMNDDSNCPSSAVWRTLVENEYGLGTVDFDGTYTLGD